MQIGREQLRALPHNDGHGFPAAGIAVGIHPGRVYVITSEKQSRKKMQKVVK